MPPKEKSPVNCESSINPPFPLPQASTFVVPLKSILFFAIAKIWPAFPLPLFRWASNMAPSEIVTSSA